ncbi:MAG TPA: DUF1844 domain-containing protein [bacterium]|nr:DUF1844 domain-containing protein [bacterium]
MEEEPREPPAPKEEAPPAEAPTVEVREAAAPPPETPSPEPTAGEPVDAGTLVMTCISLLASKAWEAMGLVPDPATRRIERRMEDAQLAIDAAAALLDLIRGKLGETERRELDTLLMNLRLNFVEQRSKA